MSKTITVKQIRDLVSKFKDIAQDDMDRILSARPLTEDIIRRAYDVSFRLTSEMDTLAALLNVAGFDEAEDLVEERDWVRDAFDFQIDRARVDATEVPQ